MTFTREENELMQKILLLAEANGNTVNPKPFDPTPEQWKMLHQIINKLDYILKFELMDEETQKKLRSRPRSRKLKKYRVNFVDGHDLKYKVFFTMAEDSKQAETNLRNSYTNGDFDHQIYSIDEVEE